MSTALFLLFTSCGNNEIPNFWKTTHFSVALFQFTSLIYRILHLWFRFYLSSLILERDITQSALCLAAIALSVVSALNFLRFSESHQHGVDPLPDERSTSCLAQLIYCLFVKLVTQPVKG